MLKAIVIHRAINTQFVHILNDIPNGNIHYQYMLYHHYTMPMPILSENINLLISATPANANFVHNARLAQRHIQVNNLSSMNLNY